MQGHSVDEIDKHWCLEGLTEPDDLRHPGGKEYRNRYLAAVLAFWCFLGRIPRCHGLIRFDIQLRTFWCLLGTPRCHGFIRFDI